MTKILVNTRLLISDKLAGIGWFTYESLKRITVANRNVKFYFVFDRAYSDEFIFSDNVHPIVISPPARHPVLWYYWFEHKIPEVINKIQPDIFLSPDGYISLKSDIKTLAVIHDINFFHYPKDMPLSSSLFYNYYFPRYAEKATRLATVSEYSKHDIHKHYGIPTEKIDVLYNGYNLAYKPIAKNKKRRIKREFTGGNDYFIFVGSLLPRKNIENMLLAYQNFIDNSNKLVDFIIVGEKLFMTKEIRKTWENMKNKDNVHFVGRQASETISKLVASAIALVLVSKLEGFGIPVIEAYACRTPAIVSNVSSLPEVAGNAAIYTNAASIDSISNALMKIANDEELRKQLSKNAAKICKQFSWDKTADLLWSSIVKTSQILL